MELGTLFLCETPDLRAEYLNMENISRYLIVAGLILVLLGCGFFLTSKLGLPLGRLPGDIRIEGQNGYLYFPIVTSIIVSIVLTIVINLCLRLIRK